MSEERLTAEEIATMLAEAVSAYTWHGAPAKSLVHSMNRAIAALRLSVSGLSEQDKNALRWATSTAQLMAMASNDADARAVLNDFEAALRALLERMGG